MRFRKKPVVIDAEQYDGSLESMVSISNWENRNLPLNAQARVYGHGSGLFCQTLEGPLRVSVGDWIIKGVHGEFYPCKPDIFEATYEQVEDTNHD